MRAIVDARRGLQNRRRYNGAVRKKTDGRRLIGREILGLVLIGLLILALVLVRSCRSAGGRLF